MQAARAPSDHAAVAVPFQSANAGSAAIPAQLRLNERRASPAGSGLISRSRFGLTIPTARARRVAAVPRDPRVEPCDIPGTVVRGSNTNTESYGTSTTYGVRTRYSTGSASARVGAPDRQHINEHVLCSVFEYVYCTARAIPMSA